jgi:hypothetical protein
MPKRSVSAQKVVAGDHGVNPTLGGDRDDQDAVMEEQLGELGVGVLVLDQDVVSRQVAADRFLAAVAAALDRLVEIIAAEPPPPG